jgi:hypothetical protein
MNLVYAWAVERIAPEKRQDWEMMLSEPLPSQVAKKADPTPFQAKDEEDAFMATMAMHQAQRTPA